MATVFLRIDHKTAEDNFTERFLFNCTARQESLLRRCNRKQSSKDRVALFVTLLCLALPSQETLQLRKTFLQKFADKLVDLTKVDAEDNTAVINASVLSGAKATCNTFFNAPYGLFKVTKSPLSILDASADFRVSSIIITNDLDVTMLHSLSLED